MSAKGSVYKRRETWFYRVCDSSGRVIFCDNTNNWRRMFDACLIETAVVRYVERTGHEFKHSFPELVDMAAGL